MMLGGTKGNVKWRRVVGNLRTQILVEMAA